MIDLSEFESISPYTDEEASEALKGIADHPMVSEGSKFIFPGESPDHLGKLIKNVESINEFQTLVVSKLVERVLESTARNFSYDGVHNLSEVDGKFLLLSNHRDIILDPSIMQMVLYRNGFPLSEIAIGSNLISNKFIEILVRSNRMVKVVRGISARELYLSSQLLSKYIRLTITSGKNSIWLAQRQGRTKNGLDITEQGLLKMLDMSGTGTFEENFAQLNIVPLSISYEYEPCDILKARELLISRTQKYVKAEGEDWFSILTGIKQYKGNIHLNIGKPLTPQELAVAALCDKNDRYQYIRHSVDLRVIDGYKLWKTNFMAYDMLNKTREYSSRYSDSERADFEAYIGRQLNSVLENEPELDGVELRNILLGIYANPINSKRMLQMDI